MEGGISAVKIAQELRLDGVPDVTVLKFLKWLKKHKPAWEMFEQFALEAVTSGRTIGAKAIAERVRWEAEVVRKQEGDDYKINNNWVAYLARAFLIKYPGFNGMFEMRNVKGVWRDEA